MAAEKVEGSDKLIKLEVDLGKEIPVLVNLEPKEFQGVESQGMVLVVDVEGKPVLLIPEKEVPPGSIIR